ncbi:MAG: PDGLE domain-containing protein [Sulfolobales archaeon]
MISRKTFITLLILLFLSPFFGVYLADLTGYHEPLDIVAEELGLTEAEFNWTPLKDYKFPGLPDFAGYVVSGAVGLAIIIAIGYLIKHLAVVNP